MYVSTLDTLSRVTSELPSGYLVLTTLKIQLLTTLNEAPQHQKYHQLLDENNMISECDLHFP